MNWTQRNHAANVKEVVTALSGLTEKELVSPTPTPSKDIQNLEAAADCIRAAVRQSKNISVMGDYDTDGVTATSILYCVLKKMGANPYIRLPKRISEGYGLNPSVIPEFKPGLLITVDNGIAAVEAVELATCAGCEVVILDHHLPQETLPNAKIIVDPHIEPEKNGFIHYCGAGLAYKLAQLLFPDDEEFLVQMASLAAIGTVADSMPLVGDNRVIVMEGLNVLRSRSKAIREKCVLPGLAALIEVAEVYDIDEMDIGFKISPMLNAAGRLLDDGAMLSFSALTGPTYTDGRAFAESLKKINEERKVKTAEYEQCIDDVIQNECLAFSRPMCVFVPDIPEGLIGILTGRLAEKYKTPAFVFTTSAHPGVLKGSGRSYGEYNLMDLVSSVSPLLEKCGGHAGAAGLSVLESKYTEMVNAMYLQMESYEPPENDTLEYDLNIKADELLETFEEVKKYAPYGQGVPRPIFCVSDIVLSPRGGSTYKVLGKHGEHLKLFTRGYSVIGFGMSETYRQLGEPSHINVVGKISQNTFRYNSELQVEALDFQMHKNPSAGRPTSLMEALKRNGTI